MFTKVFGNPRKTKYKIVFTKSISVKRTEKIVDNS